ncbi:hypothetical protein MIT9_P0205 [Methylomarinovum caldicuralii]|uniref:Phosphatase n=1 Tax=Methylomarinovum caldicuralii TaxID=438856 RepID=A0AAU9C5F0_9GAMM|nr:alkaline phosphatase PhoX [Methylomarinovum caldicuralii]BCX80631.1 hypothetical protein MIT9_P0205 [Methylomarinovum caldicuralii]
MKTFKNPSKLLGLAIAAGMAAPVLAANDFGAKVEHLLKAQAFKYFGIVKPLPESASTHVAREPGQTAEDLIELAPGLKGTILTRQAGNKADMFAFWPSKENPTHTIWCIEGAREEIAPGKFNPSVQAIDINTGTVTTLVSGMSRCDGIRLTPWGTILATEEATDGGAYEILDPLGTNATIIDRNTGANDDPTHVVKRTNLPTMAWEGLTVLESGVVIAGDELRPGTGTPDKDGGAILKFVPSVPHTGGPIQDLTESPLASGTVYAMQVSCRDSKQQFGQGCEVGNAAWVEVTPGNARDDADAVGATGYYRPEDLHRDPTYQGPGVRFCWANTGNEGAKNYAEVVCGVDSDPLLADPDTRSVVVNRFIEGDEDFNSFDNLAFQPLSGNLYVIEDHSHGDIFACLPDGADRNIKSDGCIKILSVRDETAEPTGFGFSADGKTAYLAIQHSNDSNCPPGSDCGPVDDYNTDDIIKITGFKIHPGMLPAPQGQ